MRNGQDALSMMGFSIVQVPMGQARSMCKDTINVKLNRSGDTIRQFLIQRTGEDDRDSFSSFFVRVTPIVELRRRATSEKDWRRGERRRQSARHSPKVWNRHVFSGDFL